jgi:hypothetical protein
MGTTLMLERYAELRAEMESECRRDDVLARAGLTTAEWSEAQRAWLDKMGNELARSQFELTNRYSQAFLDRQRALRAAAARGSLEPKSPTSLRADPDPPMNPSAIVAQPAGPAPDRFPSRSSPDLSEEAVAAMMAVPDDIAGSTTLPLPSEQHRRAAVASLPFRAGAPSAPPASHAASPRLAPGGFRGDATQPPALFEEARRAAMSPLPFQPSAAQPETRMSEEPGQAKPPIAQPNGAISSGETTALTSFVQRSREQKNSVLPFEAASSTPREGGAKEPVQLVSSGGGACRLTIEQFASLSAEIAAAPKAAPQVRVRYGLDEASYTAEMAAWQRQWSADKELFERFAGLYQTYREWLAKTKP